MYETEYDDVDVGCLFSASYDHMKTLSALITFHFQWLEDVNSKVMLQNEQNIPVLLLANKVIIAHFMYVFNQF